MRNWGLPKLKTWCRQEKQFNPQSTLIFGANGVGKTAFVAQYLLLCMNDRAYWRQVMRECCRRIAEYNDGGFALSLEEDLEHLVFTSIEGGVKLGKCQTYDIDASRFGLKSEINLEPFLLPYGSVVAIDEAQRVLNARQGGIPDHVSIISEIKRHNGLTLIMACQRIMLIDKNYRELFHNFIEIEEMKHTYDPYGRLIKTTWICYEFENSFLIEKYLESGKDKRPGFGKKVQYTYDGDIFSTYDSTACEAAFFDGAENRNFEILPAPAKERSLAAAKGFNKRRFNLGSKK